MGESDGKYERWAELMDRKALGEPLTAEETEYCEQYAGEDATCARELELYDELATLDVAPSADSRALVDATLARLQAEVAAAEREEVSRLKGTGRVPRLVWLSGAAAVAAVVMALVLFPPERTRDPVTSMPTPGPRVELVYASGEVSVDGKPVKSGATLLAEGSRIDVARGSACVAMDPDIDVCTSEHTRLVLSRMRSAWRRIDLVTGKVGVQLSPQPEGWRLSVVADNVWTTAIGTAFTVQHGDAAGVRTTVLHGKVRVGSDGGVEQVVGEHQRADVLRGRPSLTATSRNDESPEWALLRPSRLWSNPVSATLEVRGLPAGGEVLLDGQVIGLAPIATLMPAGSHRVQGRVDGAIVGTREFVSEVGQLTSISFEGELVAQPATAAVAAPARERVSHRAPSVSEPEPVMVEPRPAPIPVDMLAEARRLIRSGRYEDAAARYQSLRDAYPHSPEAHTVLVSLAELELDRLGRPQQALNDLELYMRDRDGTLIEEARLIRIRALRELGRVMPEAEAIIEFLREHPRSFKAAALERRLDELRAGP